MPPSAKKTDIKEPTKEQLVAWLESQGIKPYRAVQILKWVYLRQADTFDIMTDIGKDIFWNHLVMFQFVPSQVG